MSPVSHVVEHSTLTHPLDLESGWRATCPCGWVGPKRRTLPVASLDGRLHAAEIAYGEEQTS